MCWVPLRKQTNKNLRCGNRKGLLSRNDQTHHRMGPKTMEPIPYHQARGIPKQTYPSNTNYQLPNGPVKAGRRWGQRHPQGANLGANGILKFLSKTDTMAATSPPSKTLPKQDFTVTFCTGRSMCLSTLKTLLGPFAGRSMCLSTLKTLL